MKRTIALITGGLAMVGVWYLLSQGSNEPAKTEALTQKPRVNQAFKSFLSQQKVEESKKTAEKSAESEVVLPNPILHKRFEEKVEKQVRWKSMEPYVKAQQEFNRKVQEFMGSYTQKMLEAQKSGGSWVETFKEYSAKVDTLNRLMYEFRIAVAKGDQAEIQRLSEEIKAIVGAAPPVPPKRSKEKYSMFQR